MQGDLYFLLSKDHSVLEAFENISDAREALHSRHSGQYVARQDGIVVAYMSREGQTWKVVSKVPPEARAVIDAYVAKVAESATRRIL